MGQKYFTANKIMPPTLDCLREMTIVEVVSKAAQMQKAFKGQRMYFVGRKELQTVFGLTDEQIFECLSLLNVNKEVTRVGSIDFWGALALASSGSSEDKISFCFRLMDSNKDDHLSLNELVIVLICITRGLSKLKGLELIPEELIDRIVNSAFISERKKLRSDGEISSNAFVSFALANETCRQYLAAIGAKVPPVDAAALVLKRTLALKELAQVRFKIQETLFKLEDVQLREMVMLSRGGDLPYLKLTEAASVLSDKPQDVESSVSPNKSKRPPKPPGNTTSALPMGSPQRKLPTSMPASTVSHSPDASTIASSVDHDRRVEDDYLMYAQLHDSDTVPSLATFGNSAEEELILSLSKDHPVKKYIIEEDTWKNEIYRLRPLNIPPPMAQSDQSSANYSYELSTRICSSQFASDLLKQWLKLPHDEDKLVALDEATLVALFFQVGVHLSYRAAQDCLHEVIPSQLSRYSFDDIMQWFRYSFDLTDHTERARHNAFYGFLDQMLTHGKRCKKTYQRGIERMEFQRKVLSGLVRTEELNVAKKLADYRATLSRQPSLLQWQYTINPRTLRRIKQQLQHLQGVSPVDDDENNAMKWLTKMRLLVSSVPFTNISTKRPRESSRIKRVVRDTASGYSEVNIEDWENFQALDLLDYYNLMNEKAFYEEQAKKVVDESSDDYILKTSLGKGDEDPIVFNSAAWMVIDLLPGTHEAQVYLLRQVLQHALEHIPYHWRSDLFSHCYVEVCSLENAELSGTAKRKKSMLSEAIHALKQDSVRCRKVILVALMHTEDLFLNEEKKLLLADVFISRSILNGSVELNFMNTFRDLYESSMQFVHYEGKLYGPQEEELGEELSNPLFFAKEVRHRKKGLQELIDRMSEHSNEDLKKTCRELGLKDHGTKRELMDRLMEALSRKKDLIGHGELSQFAKDILSSIYHSVKQDLVYDLEGSAGSAGRQVLSRKGSPGKKEERGLTVWEFNKLLHKTQTKTFYDKAAYKEFLQDHQLLVDRDNQLLLPGLYAYYEKVGQLCEDNTVWAMGSLDDHFAGQFNMQIQYEPRAFHSMLHLLEEQPLFVPQIFRLFAYLSMLKESKVEAEIDNLSALLEAFPFEFLQLSDWKAALKAFLREPGALAVWCNDLLSSMGNPEQGPIFALRKCVAEVMESHRMRRRSAEADGAPEDDICPPPEEEDPCIRHSIPHQEALYDFTEKFSESYLQLVHEEMDRVYGQLLADLKAQRAELEGTVEDEEVSRASAKEVLGKEGDKIQRGGNGSEEVSVVTEAVQPSSPAPREENVAEPQADGEGGMLEASLAARSLAHVNGPLFEVLARRALEPYLFPTPPFHPPTSQHENPPSSDSSIPAASTHSLHTSERSFLQHNLDAMKREVIDDLLFLSQVRQIEGLTLSLKQSIAIDERRQYLQALLEHLVALMDHVDLILCVYLLASYDLFRLIGKGVLSSGWGTKDICIRGVFAGVDIFQLFPACLGEENDITARLKAKETRFHARRQAALAAVERERLRRMMTDEDKERIIQERKRQERLAFEAQDRCCHISSILRKLGLMNAIDRAIYEEAKRRLDESREERKLMSELGHMVKLFEEYFKRKESRLPEGLDTLIARNNLACVMVEIYGVDHPLCEPAQYYLQEALDLFPECVDDLGLDGPTEATGSEDLGTEEANQEGNTMEKNDNSELAEDQGEQEGPNIQNAAIKALMVLNYLDILHRTKSFTALRTAMPYKEFLVDCLKCLSQKQREKLVVGAVPAFRGVDVFFTHAQHEALLHAVVQEVAFSTSNLSLLAFISSAQQQAALKAKQEEEAARIAAEEASAAAATEEDDHKSLSSSTLTKTSAQLRREKKAKYAEQRAKDNQLRIQVSRQRALLYEYIRTDKISEVFAAQASTTMTAHSAFGVDVDEAKKLEEERNAFAEVATAMAEQTMERTKTREDAMAKTPKGPSSPSQF